MENGLKEPDCLTSWEFEGPIAYDKQRHYEEII